MNINAWQKIGIAVALYATWGWMVYSGKAPADDFVGTTKILLMAVAGYHALRPNGQPGQ